MCGIIGIVSRSDCVLKLLKGLENLAYRGYDSAGLVTHYKGALERRRSAGKLVHLKNDLAKQPLRGSCGMGHTRWATHGPPTVENAHPHMDGKIAVVHNGIIENHGVLRESLARDGCIFESQTDTEVIVHLLSQALSQGQDLEEAVPQVFEKLRGAFSVVIMVQGRPDLLIAGRKGANPLSVARGPETAWVVSDALAFGADLWDNTYLEDGDFAFLTPDGVKITNTGQVAHRLFHALKGREEDNQKNGYPHFMLKEILEQPKACSQTLKVPINSDLQRILREASRLLIVACGSSFYAGLIGRYWFEQFAQKGVDVEIASEWRYSPFLRANDCVMLAISQSGETGDVLGAVAHMNPKLLVSVVNREGSALERLSSFQLRTQAGVEIGVAATKTFTSQLIMLARLCNQVMLKESDLFSQELDHVPQKIHDVLEKRLQFQDAARLFETENRGLFVIGKGIQFLVALEGALKFKELTYLHAQGYAAGELKHGPLALVDQTSLVIGLAPMGQLFEKTLANLEEVRARGGRLIVLTDEEAAPYVRGEKILILPTSSSITAPFVYTVALQLLAYYTAVLRGCDVDQPRNLAKSVTVE